MITLLENIRPRGPQGPGPAENPEVAASPEPVEGIERAASPLFLPAGMQKMIQKVPKIPHFYSFLHTEKYPTLRVSATQSATNPIPPAKIQPKSRKVAKNNPIAGISSARTLRLSATVGSFLKSCPSSSSSLPSRSQIIQKKITESIILIPAFICLIALLFLSFVPLNPPLP